MLKQWLKTITALIFIKNVWGKFPTVSNNFAHYWKTQKLTFKINKTIAWSSQNFQNLKKKEKNTKIFFIIFFYSKNFTKLYYLK